MFHLIQSIAYLPMKMVYPTTIYGKKNLPKGKAILAINHTSNLDSIVFLLGTFEKKYYLAKKELFTSKARSAFLKNMGAIKIDRSTADVGAIKEAFRVLKNDKKLVIFPEGTRNKTEEIELGKVKSGAAMIAIKSKTNLVPVWIFNRPKPFKMTRIMIGKPFSLEQFYGKKLSDQVLKEASEIISQKLNEVKNVCEKRFNKSKKKEKKDVK